MNSPALSRYQDNLANPRPPGTGCHGWIMSTANLGVMSGRDPQQLHDEIRRTIPTGSRKIPDREITDAINKALSDFKGGAFMPKPRIKPVVKDGKTALQKIIDQGKISNEADLWEISPIRIDWPPEEDVQYAL
jgi:hypothetical protein